MSPALCEHDLISLTRPLGPQIKGPFWFWTLACPSGAEIPNAIGWQTDGRIGVAVWVCRYARAGDTGERGPGAPERFIPPEVTPLKPEYRRAPLKCLPWPHTPVSESPLQTGICGSELLQPCASPRYDPGLICMLNEESGTALVVRQLDSTTTTLPGHGVAPV
ncbi:unnamed protein product [Boreogadus saida]